MSSPAANALQSSPLDPAHLLLLTRFLSPQRIGVPWGAQWDEVLGERVGVAIQRLRDEGLIEEINVEEKLMLFRTAASLRALLKAAGLPTRGSKSELACRFASERTGEAIYIVAGLAAERCSTRSRMLAEAAVEKHRGERMAAEFAALDAMTKGNFAGAARAVVEFETRQVFPRGLNIRWDESEITRLAISLRYLHEAQPTILRDMSSEALKALRPAAAMMMLWGEARLREKLETSTRFSCAHCRPHARIQRKCQA